MVARALFAKSRHPGLGDISEFCFYATHLRYGDLTFDIGANHGTHTRQMLQRGARVVSVEPQPAIAGELRRRFPGATVVSMAVSEQPGTGVLHLRGDSDLFASLDPNWWDGDWATEEQVEITTADALIERYGFPAFMKIDTEGHDHLVLRGLTHRIPQILVEVHVDHAVHVREMLHLLDALGPYQYRLERSGSWQFAAPQTPDQILGEIATWPPRTWGNVHARLAG